MIDRLETVSDQLWIDRRGGGRRRHRRGSDRDERHRAGTRRCPPDSRGIPALYGRAEVMQR